MRTIEFDLDTLRTFLHLLGVTVWVGGQILMLGLLPVLRKAGGDLPKQAAAAFGRVAWPFFALAVFTGIWNIFAVDLSNVSSSYNAVFGIKLLAVVASGGAAFAHQKAEVASVRGITGALGFGTALIAMILGVALGH